MLKKHCLYLCGVHVYIWDIKPQFPEIKLIYSLIKMPLEHFRYFLKELSDSVSSVQFSHSVVSDSLQPHESQHTRPPCPSPTPGVHSDSRPSSQWCHQPSHPLLPPSSPAPIPPDIRVFSNESTLRMRWPKYWSFSFSIIPSKEIPGLISRMDWLDLLAVQGTLKSLLQHHSSKASVLQRSAFFTVQLSHPRNAFELI